jgi:hypothetical protein
VSCGKKTNRVFLELSGFGHVSSKPAAFSVFHYDVTAFVFNELNCRRAAKQELDLNEGIGEVHVSEHSRALIVCKHYFKESLAACPDAFSAGGH